MPLQQRQLLRRRWLSYPQCMKHLALFRAERRHPRDRLAAVQAHAVMLDALQLIERPLGRVARIGGLQPATHHPVRGFATLEDARLWGRDFVRCYNFEHRHSGIRYVTPAQRYALEDRAILAARDQTYL